VSAPRFAGAQKQPRAKPIFEQANLPADGTMGDVELLCGAREAAEPGGGLKRFDRVQGRQARATHSMSFSHEGCQNKSFVIKPS